MLIYNATGFKIIHLNECAKVLIHCLEKNMENRILKINESYKLGCHNGRQRNQLPLISYLRSLLNKKIRTNTFPLGDNYILFYHYLRISIFPLNYH